MRDILALQGSWRCSSAEMDESMRSGRRDGKRVPALICPGSTQQSWFTNISKILLANINKKLQKKEVVKGTDTVGVSTV